MRITLKNVSFSNTVLGFLGNYRKLSQTGDFSIIK